MRSTMISNPSPFGGYETPSAAPRPGIMAQTGAPSFDELRRPSNRSAVKEGMVNSVAPYPYFVKPYKEHWEQKISEGQSVFMRVDQDTVGTGTTMRMSTLANLPIVNYFLATEAADMHVPPDKDFFKTWSYMGTHSTVMTDRSIHRMSLVATRGRAMIHNVWTEARQGDELYFAVVNVPANFYQSCESQSMMDALGELRSIGNAVPDTSMRKLPDGSPTTAKDEEKPRLQIVPVNMTRQRDMLKAYISNNLKSGGMCHLIPVGRVLRTPGRHNTNRDILHGMRESEKMKQLHLIEVIQRIHQGA